MIKKILFVCSVYKPNIGGVEIAIDELSRSLSKKGVETTVLTKLFPFNLSIDEKINDSQIIRIKRPHTEAQYLESIQLIKQKEKILKADIVHIIGVRRPMPLYALLLARHWNVPCIVTFAGGDLPDPHEIESIRLWDEGKDINTDAIKQADRFTTFSHYTASLATKTIPELQKIKIIYAGIDIEKVKGITPHKESFDYFFSARRLDNSKGIDLLIRAYRNIKDKVNGAKLIIAGDGVESENLQKLVKSLHIGQQVLFVGEMENAQVIAYMKGAIAHLCPSRSEGGGIVNYEAQASGCVAIGSDAGGIPEYIIDKKTGFLFQNENIEELSRVMLLVYQNKNIRKNIISNAYKEVQNKTWAEFSKQYLDLYDRLTKQYEPKEFKPWSSLTKDMWKEIGYV